MDYEIEFIEDPEAPEDDHFAIHVVTGGEEPGLPPLDFTVSDFRSHGSCPMGARIWRNDQSRRLLGLHL